MGSILSSLRTLDSRAPMCSILLAFSAAICVGQTSGPSGAPASTQNTGVQSSIPGAAPVLTKLRGGDASIRLGSGDLVEVSVYDVPELATKARISDTGDIDLPLVNNVHVEGLTVNDAERVIERRLEEG